MEQVAVRAWGNSQGIRIPKHILEQLNINVADTLQIKVKDGAIILKKGFEHRSFEERLSDYDGKISISDFDWGEPMGKELL